METTAARFDADVLQASRKLPVLVDFWAPWCGPCRVLGPLLEKLEAEAAGAWRLVKVNTDQEQKLASMFRIQGIPAVKLFSGGKQVGEFTGALPESAIRKFLEEHIPDESRMRLEAAETARAAGDSDTARKLAQEVVSQKPELTGASLLLAELSLPAEPERALALVDAIPDRGDYSDRIDAVKTLASLPGALERGDPQQPAWKLYHEGIRSFLAGEPEPAIEAWLDALARKRSLDDDGLRKACVALFTWSGPDSDLRARYHNRFASALF